MKPKIETVIPILQGLLASGDYTCTEDGFPMAKQYTKGDCMAIDDAIEIAEQLEARLATVDSAKQVKA
jgi:hypothetical protein